MNYKSELMLPTTDGDPSYEKFQPPDPPPDSIQTKPDLKQPPDDPRRTSPDLTNPTATITTSKDAGSDQNTAASLLTNAKDEMVLYCDTAPDNDLEAYEEPEHIGEPIVIATKDHVPNLMEQS